MKMGNQAQDTAVNTSNNKAFTLVEVVGVLVLLALVALIATPVVTSIIVENKSDNSKLKLKKLFDIASIEIARNTDVDIEHFTLTNGNLKYTIDSTNYNVSYSGKLLGDGIIDITPTGVFGYYFEDGVCTYKNDDTEGEILVSTNKTISDCIQLYN